MSISPIESVLQQIRALGAAASGQVPPAAPGDAGGFARELARSLDRVSGAQQHATGQAQAFELGAPGVALNDVMVDLQKANIGFQTALQVRNRMVAAYQEVMSLQV